MRVSGIANPAAPAANSGTRPEATSAIVPRTGDDQTSISQLPKLGVLSAV